MQDTFSPTSSSLPSPWQASPPPASSSCPPWTPVPLQVHSSCWWRCFHSTCHICCNLHTCEEILLLNHSWKAGWPLLKSELLNLPTSLSLALDAAHMEGLPVRSERLLHGVDWPVTGRTLWNSSPLGHFDINSENIYLKYINVQIGYNEFRSRI